MKVSIHASAIAPEEQCFCEATCAQPRCETNAMPGRCYAPVESALARLAFSCRLLVGAYGAALPVWLPRRRKRKRGSLRPRQIDRASANRIKHCQCGCNTKNTRMRCSFRNTRATPTKSQRICEVRDSTSRRNHARCSARAHIRAPSASVYS